MPVISISNPKGGAGKSTTALILATVLAEKGATVSILDCDPNQPIDSWSQGGSKSAVRVHSDILEGRIIDLLDQEASERQFVIVDLEGTASRLVSRAIARSDLVIIPMQASAVDSKQAAKAIRLIREESQLIRQPIAYRLVFTRTSAAIPTRAEKSIIKELERSGAPLLETHLNERAAYKAVFAFSRTLAELDQDLVAGVPAAIENANRFAGEVVSVVRSLQKGAAA